MRIVALINQKGGCGKTTCSINLAACLAHLGQRTLLVDMDPQGHCAVGLAVPDAQIEKSVYDILRTPGGGGGGGTTLKDITWQIAANFDLAPSNISLAALETELHGVNGRQDRLADAIARVGTDYDVVIIDCPPNVGLLTFNAMRAATDVLIPVETGYFSLHGLSKQLELLEQLRKQCRQEPKIRILATLYDIRTKLAREVLAELREQFGPLLMESAINFNTKLKEAASFGQPITEYDPASKGFKDFLKLAREVMGPTSRFTLNLPRAVPAEDEPAERTIERAQETVEETFDAMDGSMDGSVDLVDLPPLTLKMNSDSIPPSGGILTQPFNPDAALGSATSPFIGNPITAQEPFITNPGNWRNQRLADEALTKRAEEVKAAAHQGMGILISAPRQGTTNQKIEEFYGVRQLPEGLLFVAHFPNARSVAIAGDFNNWNPQRMTSDAANQNADTFRTIVVLKPGRYRYRLVVDGRWQPDPHNMHALPNPFGELDSVVEVV